MKRNILFLLSIYVFTANAQKMDRPQPINISDIISYEEFQTIIRFTLGKGQTQTYCNMYNDNPYYMFDNEVRLYLNPGEPFIEVGREYNIDSYNEIVLKMDKKDYPFLYTFIIGDKKTRTVYLEPYWDNEKSMRKRQKSISKYMAEILKEVNQKNKEKKS